MSDVAGLGNEKKKGIPEKDMPLRWFQFCQFIDRTMLANSLGVVLARLSACHR